MCSQCGTYVQNLAQHFARHQDNAEVYKVWCSGCKKYYWNWLRHAITQHFYAMDVVQIKSHYKVHRQTELHEGLVPPGEWVCEAKWSNDENCHISVPRILRCSVFQEYLKTVNNGVDVSPDQYRVDISPDKYRTVFERNDEIENRFFYLNINPTNLSSSAAARQHSHSRYQELPPLEDPKARIEKWLKDCEEIKKNKVRRQ
uniref:C2H2-type domain-containing protein n=1 Tax=Panagrolaimus sp. PS1159 TaxID=55785 RepID=A0AC35EUH0_9BILA